MGDIRRNRAREVRQSRVAREALALLEDVECSGTRRGRRQDGSMDLDLGSEGEEGEDWLAAEVAALEREAAR